MIPHSVPNRPWSQVGANLFELVDYYSGVLKVHLTAQEVVKLLHTVNLNLPDMAFLIY